MKQMFNLPQYKTVNYRINKQTGYFTKTEVQPDKMPAMRLPHELKISPLQIEKINFDGEIIHGLDRKKKGEYKFFTAMNKTYFQNWFVGNDIEWGNGPFVYSTILYHFSANSTYLTVYFFRDVSKDTLKETLLFAHSVIPHLLKLQLN